MIRLNVILARTLLAAFLSSVAVMAQAQGIDLNRLFSIGREALTAVAGVSEQDEQAMGREIAGRMLGAAPLVNDAALQAYVNRVGRWIAQQSERPDLPWRFAVIDTASINAFAAPGGYVMLTRGLYDILDSEAQLAGVLAHEIGHVVKRHHVTVMQKSAALSAGSQIAQRDNRSAMINNMIGTGAEVFARGLDKSAEYEADAVGVVLAARAGYNPFGLVDVLHKLAARLLERNNRRTPRQHGIRHTALLFEHSATTSNISRCFVDGESRKKPGPTKSAALLKATIVNRTFQRLLWQQQAYLFSNG
jgi:predicted Zn-dependent protease